MRWSLLKGVVLGVLVSQTMVLSLGHSQMVPFGFWKTKPPILDFDFVTNKTLPSQLTFARASTATYFDAAGVMQVASANTPRFDHDSVTLESEGLLIEPGATNMIPCSENIALGTCWTKDGTTTVTTLDSVLAPDGTMTADKIAKSGGLAYVYPVPVPATTTGVNYTFSVYMRTPSGSGTVGMALQDIVTYSSYAFAHKSVNTTWKRFTVTGAKTTGNGMRSILVLDAAHVSEVYIWGAQLEVGSKATSYIPTAATTATRADETLSFNTMSWYNPSEGSMFAEYVNNDADASTNFNIFGVFNTDAAGTYTQNAIQLADSNVTAAPTINTSGSAVCAPGGSVNAAGTINRMAMTYGTNVCQTSLNRAAVVTDATVALPSAAAYGYIGSQPGSAPRSRYIRKIKYFSPVLGATTLQGL